MKSLYALALLLLCVGASAKVVYKTIQADGSVIYSDTPTTSSTPVNLSAMNNVVMPALNNAASKKPNSRQVSKKQNPQVQYQVSIVSPMHEESIRDNSGNVSIRASVSPNGASKYQLIMDNQVVKTQSNSLFELEGVNRGAHLIQIHFIDNSGKILASSQQQTFYLHKASALNNVN
ncbi:DUF4124 domain-containing protein [Paraglaciecola aquimarina]|uniref:DUF4124 domain-containing protein n=1 Tax=Paraglaciecola algarum TaxID=3050085 RepID=A0ABS9D9K0_9ALTE|nr:DUF4124 domain-containing protein [Paraglaciecola sp. G1-23]MCF2948667.1 DUF4124 domain-containing protein [Paraglaciecola sp. G1-23]